MPQFLVEKEIHENSTIEIAGDDAHHITHVLRLLPGNWILISDGMGGRFRCLVENTGKKSVTLRVAEKLSSLDLADITLAQAITKHDKFEFIIQKSIELGVRTILPFESERTIPNYSQGATESKYARWNKIALEAAKQCGLPYRPAVKPMVRFDDIFKYSGNFTNRLMFYEGEHSNSLKKYFSAKPSGRVLEPEKTIIIIGPEGGFTDDEVNLARKEKFETLKLGPLIMRVETAAVAATTLVQHFLGHFD